MTAADPPSADPPSASLAALPQKGVLVVLALANMASPFAMQIFPPAAPFVRDAFGTSIAETQWSVTAFSLVLAIALLAFGPLSDRYDHRKLLLIGFATFCVGSVIGAVADGLGVLILGRALQAVGAGAGAVIARSAAATLYPRDRLAEVYGIMNMIIVVAPMFAPLIAGVMLDTSGWRGIMWFLAATGLAMIALTQFGMHNALRRRAPVKSGGLALAGFMALLSNRLFALMLLLIATSQMSVFIFLSSAPYVVIDLMGRSATEYGSYFVALTVTFFFGSYTATRFTRRLGPLRMLAIAVAANLAATGIMSAFVFAGIWTPWSIVAPVLLLTYSNGAIQPVVMAEAMIHADGHEGSASSLTGFALIMASAVGLQLAGTFQGATPRPMAALMLAAGAILLLNLAALMRYNRAPHRPT